MPNLVWGHRTIYQLTIIGAVYGQQIINTHHFEAAQTQEAGLTNDTLAQQLQQTLITAWVTSHKAKYLALFTGDYGMQMVKCQVLERPNQWRHRLLPTETISTGPGTETAQLPPEDSTVAAVLRWRTPQASRSTRGRNYFGPWPNSWRANGMVVAAGATKIETYRDSLLTMWGAQLTPAPADFMLIIYSRPYNHGEYSYVQGKNPNRQVHYPEDYAGNSTGVISGAVDPVLRSMRSRQVGVGA
jgi:hypothetical protein